MPEEQTTSDDEVHLVSADDVADGERVLIDVAGREIAVFNVDGEYHAVLNYCTHQSGPICEGPTAGVLTERDDGRLEYERDGEFIVCPWHGWKFDIASGKNAQNERYNIPTYDVVSRNGELYLRK
jgi:nitrite reductase/ring-hydroxylating ferredoxin subunit